MHHIDVYLGHAAFRSPHELVIDGRSIHGRAFLLCTASHSAVPALPGLEESDVLTNETIFGLRTLPVHPGHGDGALKGDAG